MGFGPLIFRLLPSGFPYYGFPGPGHPAGSALLGGCRNQSRRNRHPLHGSTRHAGPLPLAGSMYLLLKMRRVPGSRNCPGVLPGIPAAWTLQPVPLSCSRYLFYSSRGRLPLHNWHDHVRCPCIVPFLWHVSFGQSIREKYTITYKKIQSAGNLPRRTASCNCLLFYLFL